MATVDPMRRTKIVATIGPATESKQVLRQLIEAGATTFRLNFSHGDHEDHAERITAIRQVAEELGVHIGILQDLQGPKIRLGRFEAGPISLATGDAFTLTSRQVNCNQAIATVTYDKLAEEVHNGCRILLDDGRVEMVVEHVDQSDQSLKCRVTVGGVLSNNKGVNFPDVQLSIRALTPKDRRDLAFGLQQDVDWVALSFVRNPSDMQEIRDLIRSHGCTKANSLGIPIITATQMLDSMASCPRPTRAEVSDVANAILDGTDAVMLSNETAVGDYPVEAVATMARIARRIERDYPRRILDGQMATTIPNAISQAVSSIARQLNAAAILPLTKSGATARNVSKFRPSTPILAITSEESVARQLQLVWGVNPLLIPEQPSTASTFTLAMGVARQKGLLREGDLVVETAGTLEGVSGSTDLVKVGIVSAVLGRGIGIGTGSVSGRVHLANSPEEADRLENGEILVVRETNAAYLDAIRKAKGVIVEAEGRQGHLASVAERLGVPVIVGVANATLDLRQGEIVTLELVQGMVHRGAQNPHSPFPAPIL
jgi:pyruvate kinase